MREPNKKGLLKINTRISTFVCILLFSILIPSVAFSKDELLNSYPIEVIEVKDGDTLKVRVHQWIDTWLTTSIRIYGINTPEKTWRGKCDAERALGEQATTFAKEWVKGHQLHITKISNDKFGGRIDALVVRDDGQELGRALIANGYAKPYYGKTKSSWCK